ncbi:choice-of-anchor D domain-containing protein, partial [Flavobacterium sp.]|uniref:beta strand repeat-containing protein n=1 Tax=Flavobacterium sp. TaxID=239 RepID=UPI002B4AB3EE
MKIRLLLLMMLFSVTGWGQILIPNTTPVTQNFDSMGATSTAALPANWKISAAGASAPTWAASGNFIAVNIQASSGSPATGGRYNWGISTTERAVGVMTSGSYDSPNSIMAYYKNTNASNLTQLTVSYNLERYRINNATASVQFFYSLNGTSWTAVTGGDVAAASLPTGTSAYNFGPGLTVNVAAFNITGLNIITNSDIYLRWNINTGGGNSQGIGIDDVSVTGGFTVAVPSPEINLQGNATTITDEDISPIIDDNTDLGSAGLSSGTIAKTFTIQNTGTALLDLTDAIPYVVISGIHASDFALTVTPSNAIPATESTTFEVTFNPSGAGVRTAVISIANNDSDESLYNFSIQGTGIDAPIITSDLTASGSQGTALTYSITASNSPTSYNATGLPSGLSIDTLTGVISGTPSVSGTFNVTISALNIEGTDTETLVITIASGPCLSEGFIAGITQPSGWTFTSIDATYTSVGNFGASSPSIKFDDTNDVVETATFSNAVELSFWMVGNSTNAASSLLIEGFNGTIWVTVDNIANLPTTGTTKLYNFSSIPTLPANIQSFRFTYTKSAGNLALDDINVNCTPSTTAEINITGNSNSIANGDATPTLADATDFGSTDITSGSVIKTFTIQNTGVVDLNLTDASPYVIIAGANATDFTITAFPTTPITASGSTDFQVTFNPSTVGLKTAMISIANDDSNENPYNFSIQGTGTAPLLNDLCSDATLLTVNTAAIAGNLSGATPTSGLTYAVTKNDVWYSFTPSCSGMHTITLNGFTGNVDFDVFTTSCPTSGIGGSIAHTTSTPETVTAAFTSGLTYYIRVIAYNLAAETSAFTLQVVSNGSLLLTNTGSPAAGNIYANTNDVVLFGFDVTPNSCTINYDFTSVIITETGTATIADLSNFRIFYDTDGNGAVNGGEVSVSGIGIDLAATMNFTMAGQTGLVAARKYLLVANVAVLAIGGNTFMGSIASSTNLTATLSPSGSVTGTAAGNIKTIIYSGPEINVTGNTISITDGDITPITGDHTRFGTIATLTNGSRTYTIQNTGNLDLVLEATPITLSDVSLPLEFTISQPVLTTIPPGGFTTFTVIFNSAVEATFVNTIIIGSNDGNEGIYNFDIKAAASDVIPAQTIFKPGDLIFVGYDSKVGTGAGCGTNGSDDKFYIATLVDITPNTEFLVVNSRYESGAAANVRTDRWYGSGNAPYEDPGTLTFLWNGPGNISAGSVLSFKTSGSFAYEISIDNIASPDLTATGGLYPCNISSSDPDQIYIMQGAFTPFGTTSVDRYNTFNGRILYGLTNGRAWVSITSAVSAGTGGGSTRESRLPDDIECFNIESLTLTGVRYYKNSALHTGSKSQLLGALIILGNWSAPANDNCLNITENFSAAANDNAVGKPFVINSGNPEGTWTGGTDNDWFKCSNWEGLAVPKPTDDVIIPSVTNQPVIGASPPKFPIGAFSNNITIENSSSLTMSNALSRLNLYGNWTNDGGNVGFAEGLGTVYFEGSAPQIINNVTPEGTETFYNLILNNNFDTNVSNDIIAAGNLTVNTGKTLTIFSNDYAQVNKMVTNNGTFNILNNGSLVQTEDGYTDVGSLSMKRTASIRKYDYVYWSSPVANFHVSGVSPGTSSGLIYKWNTTIANSNNGFGNWENANENMVGTKGYIIRGPNAFDNTTLQPLTAEFIGVANNGIYTPTISRGSYTGPDYQGTNGITVTKYDDNWN